MFPHIEGLIAAPFTPLLQDGGINVDAIATYSALLHRNGVAGVFICGTTGESLSLTTQERMVVAERWTAVAPRELKVIVHVGHAGLEDAKALAAHAQRIGAWGVGAMPPCFFKPADVGALVACCRELAAVTPELPFYYYHTPSMTGVNFPMIDFLAAAQGLIPNLAGIEFTYENLMDFAQCREYSGGRYDLLFGRDEILLCGLALGARGTVGSTYNFAAPLYHRLIAAFDAGDLATARALQQKSIELIRVLGQSAGSFFTAAKAVMGLLGVECGPLRSPLPNITPAECERLQARLEASGFREYCCR